MKYAFIKSDTKRVNGVTLTLIRALIDIPSIYVKAGDLGGYIENELNLSQEDTCWVFDNATVSGNARVFDNAIVSGKASVFDNACVSDNARVSGNAQVFGNARVFGNATVSGDADVFNNARVSGNAQVFGNARVESNALIDSNDKVMWFSNVGSENGTLTVYATENGLDCTRGCFTGTIDEFLAASAVKHANNARIREEYQLAIEIARLKIK